MGYIITESRLTTCVAVIFWYIFTCATEESEHVGNYTTASFKCRDHGGLLQENVSNSSSLFSGIIENADEVDSYNSLTESIPLWVSGLATSGPYIALYTCMSLDKHTFVENVTFHSNILYECSVHCARKLNLTGYFGITRIICFCIIETYRSFPYSPECLERDFLDINKGIIVFRFREHILRTQSKSPDFNCISALIEKEGTQYYNTKCSSALYGLCSHRIDSPLSSKCISKVNDDELCLNKENGTFLEHILKCVAYNGTLLSFNFRKTITLNFSVMLGSFRTFKAVEDNSENKDNVSLSCLSITKVKGIIYLETENCSNENAFICMDVKHDISNTSGSETKDDANTNNKHFLIIICSILVGVCVMLVLLVIWLLYRQHSKQRPRYNKGTSQNDMYITPATEVRFKNDATQVVESAANNEVEGSNVYDEIVEVGNVRNTAAFKKLNRHPLR